MWISVLVMFLWPKCSKSDYSKTDTIGNAIAGLIVMTSRPFRVGDRIFFNGQFADVVAIELIYTKMVTLDNVLVSVPN